MDTDQAGASELALRQWAADRERITTDRYKLVQTAFANGISKYRIHELSGMARTTIDEILSKVNDPEMRQAIVQGVAQYILRGEAHTKNPAHSDAQILARARHDMTDTLQYGYAFPEDEPEKIAADAKELARYVQDHDVNWDQWAFGH